MTTPTSHPSATAASGTPMSANLVVFLLALLLGIQPVTTDLYLPVLPALTQSLSASMSQAQLTLTALSLSFGVSQLVWGPLSDRFGRRPILIWGMAFYAVASFGAALASTIDLFIIWRMAQGAAMGAAVSSARAIVRDLYAPIEGARMMSKGLTGLGVLACCSAPTGALLGHFFGWRATLFSVAVYGVFITYVLATRFLETNPHKNPRALRPTVLASNWWHIAKTRAFWAFTALAIASYACLFTFLAASSFVFIDVLGLNKLEFGAAMFSISLSYIGGTLLCRRLIVAWGIRRALRLAGFITLGSGTVMGILPFFGIVGIWTILVPIYGLLIGHGIHQPCSQSGAVSPFPKMAGAASALNGFLMMVAAFFVGTWLGDHMDGTVQPLTSGIWFWTVMIAMTAWFVVPRWGDLPQEDAPPKRVPAK